MIGRDAQAPALERTASAGLAGACGLDVGGGAAGRHRLDEVWHFENASRRTEEAIGGLFKDSQAEMLEMIVADKILKIIIDLLKKYLNCKI